MSGIVISGYYGADNAGDEAILAAVIAQLRQRRPSALLTVISRDPPATSALHGVDAIRTRDLYAIAEAVRTAELVLSGGGGLFHEQNEIAIPALFDDPAAGIISYALPLVLASIYGVPRMLLGQGIGPVVTEDGAALIRFLAGLADAITVRDSASLALLREMGADLTNRPVVLAADPALLLPSAPSADVDALRAEVGLEALPLPRIGVVLRPWGDWSAPQTAQIAAALDALIDETDGTIVFTPFQGQVQYSDLDIMRGVLMEMRRRERAMLVPRIQRPDLLAGFLGGLDVVVGMRLHALMFAAMAGVPPIGVVIDPKLGYFLEQLGLDGSVVKLQQFTAEYFVPKVRAMLDQRPAVKEHLAARLPALRAKAEASFAVLEEVLRRGHGRALRGAGAPGWLGRITQVELAHQHIQTLLAELDKERRDREAVERASRAREGEAQYWRSAYEAITRSRSYRLTAPLRGLYALVRSPQAVKTLAWRAVVVASRKLPDPVRRPLRRAWEAYRTRRELLPWRIQLQDILAQQSDPRGVVIYPPTLDWNFMFQRPQQLARAFARAGYLFFFCTNNARVDDVNGFRRVADRLYVCNVPWAVFDEIRHPILYISWAAHRSLLEMFKHYTLIYDVLDDLEVGGGALGEHEALLERADIVLATSSLLWEKVATRRPDVIASPNACDYAFFARARMPGRLPRDLAPIVEQGKVIAGYHGALAKWFDYALVRQVAASRPEINFVLIGVDYDGTLKPSRLLDLPNVKWLGEKPYEALPDYLAWTAIGLVPFLINEITKATSPIKVWEYLAAGKPVVSTDLPMCRGVPGVWIGHGAVEYGRAISEAIARRHDPGTLEGMDRAARANTWDARAARIIEALAHLNDGPLTQRTFPASSPASLP